jgi:hypothetical protein
VAASFINEWYEYGKEDENDYCQVDYEKYTM